MKPALGETLYFCFFFKKKKKLVWGLEVMGALFVQSLRGRGGTRKQLGSHSKEFKERCSRERRGGVRPAGGRGRQGCPRAALTQERGRRTGRPGDRVRADAGRRMGSLW